MPQSPRSPPGPRGRAGGPGRWLVALVVGGQGLFVVAAVPPLDERFLLTLAPALLLPALLGWKKLPPRVQPWAAGTVIAIGLLVAADFHLPEVNPDELRPPAEVGMLAPSAGLGLNSSWEQRGWGRSDRAREPRLHYRAQLWARVEEASAQRIGIIRGPLIDPFGDTNWWHYRALLGEVEGTWGRQGALELVDLCVDGTIPDVDIVIGSDARIGSIAAPWCDAQGDWKPGIRIPGDNQHRGAVVWLPVTKASDGPIAPGP